MLLSFWTQGSGSHVGKVGFPLQDWSEWGKGDLGEAAVSGDLK